MHKRYTGNDQLKAANGAGVNITHIGKSILPNPSLPLYLNNILHVPHAHKQLVSIHRFNLDNHTYIELHMFFFFIKDQATRKVLLCGPCRGGLCPLPQHLLSPTQYLILSAIKPPLEWWHCRLGHPPRGIVSCIIRTNKLSCSPSDSIESMCDACLYGKAHQLPYPKSTSRSSAPLNLTFLVVWGPAIDSFGNKKYFVFLYR
jgi:hypothetical protein